MSPVTSLPRFLRARVEPVYAVVRIVVGLMLSFHGVQSLFGVLTDHPTPFGTQLWFGGVIELLAGLAVAAGAYTSWAAFLASGTMAVAYIQFHWKLDFGARFFPAVNKGEPAVLYALLFLYIACRGAGRWSLDARRGG